MFKVLNIDFKNGVIDILRISDDTEHQVILSKFWIWQLSNEIKEYMKNG